MSALTAAEAREQRAADVRHRRDSEAACALDFLVYGDGEPTEFLGHNVQAVAHADRCVFGPRSACSRTYDPMPYDEAEPVDLKMYEGTSIGTMYGQPGPELELEGWELRPRTVFE